MKILLLSLQTKLSLPVIPLGLIYIADSLERNGYNYEIMDLNFYTIPLEAFKAKLDEFKPEAVAISVRNIAESELLNNCYKELKNLVDIAKKCSIVILGGAGFSLFPKEILNYTRADYGITGPGEEAIINILQNIEDGDSFHSNLITAKKYSGFTKSNVAKVYIKYWKAYGKYHILNKSDLPVQSVRGCNNSCSYCSYPLICGSKVYFRDINQIVNEIENIITFTDYPHLYFVDSAFNMQLAYAKNLMKMIIKRNLKITWKCCINPTRFDEEFILLMKESGCIQCEVGIDSFSDKVLRILHKDYNKQDAFRLLNELNKIQIPYSVSLILGGYGETQSSVDDTIYSLKELYPSNVQIFLGTRLYPGTQITTSLGKKDNQKLMYATKDSIYISEETKQYLQNLKEYVPRSWTFTRIVEENIIFRRKDAT